MVDFSNIVLTHLVRYPQMQPQDLIKLAYQSEFGPGHMITDEANAAAWIAQEWKASPQTLAAPNPEPIGSGLCRYHLTSALYSAHNAAVLASLFIQTAQKHTGTQSGLDRRLQTIAQLPIAGIGGHIELYRRDGCPAVHHSDLYRRLYMPHYRVLLLPLAEQFQKAL